MKQLKISLFFFGIAVVGLFLYSYTQVDLSLTLSRVSLWQVIEKGFEYIGYYQRPLSTGIYIAILILLYSTFVSFVQVVKQNKVSERAFWILVCVTVGILVFSYNAFSYDLFNYIFDAKIVTHYHLNPYFYKALDFSGDPMLSFMHWVERTYPYGPVWLGITIPFSYLGSGIFLFTFYLFKGIGALGYVVTTIGIYRIAKKIMPQRALLSAMLFAFQPLVIIEGLVSAHNDIVMIALLTWALYFLVKKENTRSLILFILSVGVKFATGFLLPVWGFVWLKRWKKQTVDWDVVFFFGFLLSLIPIIAASLRTNFQPWYFLYVFPFASLIHKKWMISSITLFSLFALMEYIPFLYTGNWNPPIPTTLTYITMGGVICCLGYLLSGLLLSFLAKKKHGTIV